MPERSISQFFEYLGAPLANTRWSWGASNARAVVLRVWQDRTFKHDDGNRYVKITHQDKYMDYDKLGWQERLRHVEEVKQGKPCYLVMCLVKDANAFNREIKSFNQDRVFLAGDPREVDGEVCVPLTGFLKAAEAREVISEDGQHSP